MLTALVMAVASLFSPPSTAEPLPAIAMERMPRVVVYVDAAFFGCTACEAKEGAGSGGTGSIKDLTLECCNGGGTNGQIATSGYTLSPGVCAIQGGNCNGTKACSLSVTLTIMMGCHTELWVARPGLDPDDDTRITESIDIAISITAGCSNETGERVNESIDVIVSRANCNQPGKGDDVGRYKPVLRCKQCS